MKQALLALVPFRWRPGLDGASAADLASGTATSATSAVAMRPLAQVSVSFSHNAITSNLKENICRRVSLAVQPVTTVEASRAFNNSDNG